MGNELDRRVFPFVEIRSYHLKPGRRAEFHRIFWNDVVRLLQSWKVDVLAAGPSLHDDDSYYLIRAYPSLEKRQSSQDAFYGSDDWRKGPREPVLACIENYTTVVIQLEPRAVELFRQKNQS
jgi:hypothetical protein